MSENLRDNVERMRQELFRKEEELKRQELNCIHKFSEPVSDPEKYQDFVFSHYEGHGSDPHPIGDYVTRTRPRWKRTCLKCGKVEFTKELKAIKYEPDFH